MPKLTEDERNCFTVTYKFAEKWNGIRYNKEAWFDCIEEALDISDKFRDKECYGLLSELMAGAIRWLEGESIKAKEVADAKRGIPKG